MIFFFSLSQRRGEHPELFGMFTSTLLSRYDTAFHDLLKIAMKKGKRRQSKIQKRIIFNVHICQ
jgi:hypothetical protein